MSHPYLAYLADASYLSDTSSIMLKAANDTDETRAFERKVFELKDGEPLHIGREVQRDVVLGSKETGHAPRLVIEYQ